MCHPKRKGSHDSFKTGHNDEPTENTIELESDRGSHRPFETTRVAT